VGSENPANHILIYRSTESRVDLVGDLWTSQVGFRFFVSTTAWINSAVGPFGPGFALASGKTTDGICAAPSLDENPIKLTV
jgi:hypothetical protein